MSKYRNKPVEVDAIQVTEELFESPETQIFSELFYDDDFCVFIPQGLRSTYCSNYAYLGSWIVRNSEGIFSIYCDHAFHEEFELI